jgi:hypothetical protein
MKYIGTALLILFVTTFTLVQIVLAYTCDWWVNLLYTAIVVLTAVGSRPFLNTAISWAVFPYGNYLISLNHQ